MGTSSHVGAGVVAVGASAGGVEALRWLVSGLPPHLPAAVLVVLHIPRDSPSALPGILDRAGPLPAVPATHGARLRRGTIYVAVADHHLLIRDGHIELSRGPTENGHRPGVDPLFRSAAVAYGPGAIGVVLSGSRDDGAAGLSAIVDRGGTAVVQDPADALHSSMPVNALQHVHTEHVLPAAKIGPLLGELVGEGYRQTEPAAPPPLLAAENAMASLSPTTTDEVPSARPSGLSCPSCQGVLFELEGEPVPRYRCRVGHAWSPGSLAAEQAAAVDESLWEALRTLEESAVMNDKLAGVAERRNRHRAAERFRGRCEYAKSCAAQLRTLIARIPPGELEPGDGDES
ncbi:MAG: two-component system, chemotaxis family, response regulator CheB [Pseudonocardia sp.]|nr:two-component system, chemotaxis family, response regulator CheB [Pseudonocardia sp.]